jgi:hypothetical protein
VHEIAVKGLSIIDCSKEGWSGLIAQPVRITYENDVLTCVKGIWKKKYDKLIKIGLVTVLDLTSNS